MNLTAKDIGVGLLAGLAAALLSVGVITQSTLAMALLLFSPLPIFVAALGWGTAAGFIAALSMAVAVSVLAAPTAALIIVLITALPAAAASYFTGLARPAEEIGGPKDVIVWYPLADTLLRLALIVGASFIAIGVHRSVSAMNLLANCANRWGNSLPQATLNLPRMPTLRRAWHCSSCVYCPLCSLPYG